ncbi:hypothetical protein PR202_ga09237 [Eleusine coracana subsp. coracana]|uniref:Uncharacterized protein n=1 Tax=Eleusine coracana subsp. coracana TaxID=191504 RepID=A0AAV5C2A7_ELECO|nr:hypothetical protein PR202_ga09237 [Eleusine coracana subsp. coracana]
MELRKEGNRLVGGGIELCKEGDRSVRQSSELDAKDAAKGSASPCSDAADGNGAQPERCWSRKAGER